MTYLKIALLSGVSACLAATAPGKARAQSAVPPESTTTEIGVEDIIVTANRREQNLQDVPIAVNAVTAAVAEARGITGTSSLVTVAPSLEVTKTGNNALIFLRGVGFLGGSPNDEPSVALYADGVYMPAANGNFFNFNNIERIEVLKGPQGTLFGRNATGGVIQIITKDPSFDPSIIASAGYANYDTISGDLYATTGLTDNIAINLAAQGSDQRKGWGKNVSGVPGVNGTDTYLSSDYSFRSKLLIQAGEDTRIILSGNYSWVKTPAVSGQPAQGGGANIIGQGFPGRYNTLGDTNDYSTVKTFGASLRITHDAGPVKLTSISAYQRVEGFFSLDQDNSPVKVVQAQLTQRNRMYSQEFQVSNGDGSKIDWLIGTYYFNYDAGYDPLAIRSIDPTSNFNFKANQKSESLAVFGQVTYPVTETTNLTAGLRYTTEDQEYNGALETPARVTFLGPVNARQSFEKITWRLSVDQKLSPGVMVYASLNRGFKSGGFSLVVVPGTVPPYKPEVLDAYEIGFKSTLFDRRVRLNAAAFYYDYTNIQFQNIQPAFAFNQNGPTARIYGLEFDAQFAVTDNLNLFMTGSYLNSRYGDFPNAPRFDRIPTNGITPPQCINAGTPAVPGTNCQVGTLSGAGTVVGYNAKGNELAYAPKWTYNVGADYTIPTSIGNFTIASNVYYNDGSFASVGNRLRNPKYYTVNATLGWTSTDGHFGVSIWGRNLADEYTYSMATEQTAPFGDIISINEPRVYGLKLTVKY